MCADESGVEKAVDLFTTFLETRKHFKDLNPDGTPAPARSGTLAGYRSAMSAYIWGSTKDHGAATMPSGWHSCMAEFMKGKKKREATKNQNGELSMKEGYASATCSTYVLLTLINHF